MSASVSGQWRVRRGKSEFCEEDSVNNVRSLWKRDRECFRGLRKETKERKGLRKKKERVNKDQKWEMMDKKRWLRRKLKRIEEESVEGEKNKMTARQNRRKGGKENGEHGMDEGRKIKNRGKW
ncbi:hypothetical protein KM043_016633 [Ampulex compressa]|nr:hypothetical protein KM043_016633 [Ampulex compressa]